MPNGPPVLAITSECPCLQRMRVPPPFTDPEATVPANGNAMCFFCGRLLRTNAGALPRRASFTDEEGPPGLLVAARVRGVGLQGGRPFQNAPPRDPKPRQPWDDAGEPA